MGFFRSLAWSWQPLVGPSGRNVLVADGRIDNRRELISELGVSSAEASGLPDSAFIMLAHDRWGEGCVEHLIGAYTFAVWDLGMGRLLMARSPTGGRPIYIHRSPGTVTFASSHAGLFALPRIERRIDEEKLADFLANLLGEPGASIPRPSPPSPRASSFAEASG